MIAILAYGEGNTCSVQHALNRLGVESVITDDPAVLTSADKLIFPGVGHARAAMEYLRAKELDKLIIDLQQPVLGICLGMQLLCRFTEEGDSDGLGVFNTDVRKFYSDEYKVPHVGWNTAEHPGTGLLKGIPRESYFYFVHGYYVVCGEDTVAETDYILPFSSSLQKDNFYGVQFHPERSGAAGEKLLLNFLQL